EAALAHSRVADQQHEVRALARRGHLREAAQGCELRVAPDQGRLLVMSPAAGWCECLDRAECFDRLEAAERDRAEWLVSNRFARGDLGRPADGPVARVPPLLQGPPPVPHLPPV